MSDGDDSKPNSASGTVVGESQSDALSRTIYRIPSDPDLLPPGAQYLGFPGVTGFPRPHSSLESEVSQLRAQLEALQAEKQHLQAEEEQRRQERDEAQSRAQALKEQLENTEAQVQQLQKEQQEQKEQLVTLWELEVSHRTLLAKYQEKIHMLDMEWRRLHNDIQELKVGPEG
ncbi:kinesin-like protein KIFC1 [Sylvia atricapilla]|uniref:kinesin-like protein KIFC1 n=1 Tax=Sylvia atricapilla TaxID=48155 RepID=UPI00339A0B9C